MKVRSVLSSYCTVLPFAKRISSISFLLASRIQISTTTYEVLKGREEFELKPRGLILIKVCGILANGMCIDGISRVIQNLDSIGKRGGGNILADVGSP